MPLNYAMFKNILKLPSFPSLPPGSTLFFCLFFFFFFSFFYNGKFHLKL